jgi:hypothetical protein
VHSTVLPDLPPVSYWVELVSQPTEAAAEKTISTQVLAAPLVQQLVLVPWHQRRAEHN